MNLTEKWPVLRLQAPGGTGVVDEERLLKLFWNRAELKKELQALDDELQSLQEKVRQQDGANARLQEQLDQLEGLLGSAERGPEMLVHFALRGLWRECRRQLEQLAAELRRQRQDRERRQQLTEFENDQRERLTLAAERIREAAATRDMEHARLLEAEHRLQGLRAFWHYFRRRALVHELETQRGRLADAERHLVEMNEARRTIKREPLPEFPGLSIAGRRAVNLAVIAYAQLLYQKLAQRGLAGQARLANHRRPAESRFGSREQCMARLDDIAAAVAMVRAKDGVAAEVRSLAERFKTSARWRGESEVAPVPSSLHLAPSSSVEGTSVLIDDYWDVYRVLLP